ncbi:TetR family transcriptional regulator [Actinomadura kijaniata]
MVRMTVHGLRERKKAATRQALSRAAVRLALEHGVAGVTVEAVAEAAGVSARTFHNYFPGKEEAIVAPLLDGARTGLDTLASRPADEPLWDTLHNVARVALASFGDRAETLALVRVVLAEPVLIARELSGLDEMLRRATELIAERSGTDPARDVYPHLMAGAAGLALRTAMAMWAEGPDGADPGTLVDEAFLWLRSGLPTPHGPAEEAPPEGAGTAPA